MNRQRIAESGCSSVRGGRLFIEDLAASELVERFGSPISCSARRSFATTTNARLR